MAKKKKTKKSQTKTVKKITTKEIKDAIQRKNLNPTVPISELKTSLDKIEKQRATQEVKDEPAELRASQKMMNQNFKRFHGSRASLNWMPQRLTKSKCRNRFGYLSSGAVRRSKLAFNSTNKCLLESLGHVLGNSGRESSLTESTIPAIYTYFGQFVDHDISLDVTSTLDAPVNANSINNMRTPALDLDSLYGDGPALNPFLYEFPNTGNPTAIKFKLGSNQIAGEGGPAGTVGLMKEQTDFDVPRINGTNTAVIGDPRNDENLIVSQFHHSMLKFHNQTVDLLNTPGAGDVFEEAKKAVTHHYQWVVIEDFLKRVCGPAAVNDALANISIGINASFRLPAEFSVAAYRFGHSMVRNEYWINFNFPFAPLSDVFTFIRGGNVPVLSNWVVDFNAFADTGVNVPVFNNARKIDTVLSNGLEALPGGSGIMAMLAARNLLRGLSYGLPSGQALATSMGITPMTNSQMVNGLHPDELNVLQMQGSRLLNTTPLWYYILREAAVLENGDRLGPLGAKIVADTFVRMLKRDPNSYINSTGFTPFLPILPGTSDYEVKDILIFSGVTEP